MTSIAVFDSVVSIRETGQPARPRYQVVWCPDINESQSAFDYPALAFDDELAAEEAAEQLAILIESNRADPWDGPGTLGALRALLEERRAMRRASAAQLGRAWATHRWTLMEKNGGQHEDAWPWSDERSSQELAKSGRGMSSAFHRLSPAELQALTPLVTAAATEEWERRVRATKGS